MRGNAEHGIVAVKEKQTREDAYISRLPVSIIRSWYQQEGYMKSMAEFIKKELEKFSKLDEKPDGGVQKDEKSRIWRRSYSGIPGLIPTVEFSQKGVKSLLAVPVSYMTKDYFMSEHIETLEEIDMKALESSIQNWGHVPALNCMSSFITDLADAVLEALPSATALSSSRNISNEDDNDLVRYAIKMFFGSILAFFLLLLQKNDTCIQE
ncbi:ferrochelatase-2, chloroplastic-like [Mangifera indica]|uniref:ferrochelatase-2, chloroplastic-like n=1 Tax=Mangifera indica TaxID=29780 RepID=UPI001CFBF2BF|nr:ferrochelatase-2, chloroplastic-like [Mangifera indica]